MGRNACLQHPFESLRNSRHRSKSQFLYPIVVLALTTGVRRREILRLTWDDVDLQRRSIVLHETSIRFQERHNSDGGVPDELKELVDG